MKPFVGRADELERLDRVSEAAAAGEPAILVIAGEAGIGKSALIHEWGRRARRRKTRWLFATCPEFSLEPLLPVTVALTSLSATVQAAEERTSLPSAPPAAIVTLVRALVDVSQREPTIFVLNDAHWADEATLGFVHHVSAMMCAADPPPMLTLVVTVRDGEEVPAAVLRLSREPIAETMMLRGLSEPETAELLAELVGAAPSARATSSCFESSAGVPLLVELLVDQLEAASLFTRTRDTIDLEVAPIGVTEHLNERWWVRLDKIEPPARDLLTTIALMGDDVTLAELSAVHDVADETIALQLAELARVRLLRDGGGTALVHPSLRRALLGDLHAQERQVREQRVANALWGLRAAGQRVSPLRLVRHVERADMIEPPAWLATVLGAAATEADQAGAWSRASGLHLAAASDATAHDRHGDAATSVLRAGQSFHRAGDYREAAKHLTAAAARASSLGRRDLEGEALYWLTNAEVLVVRNIEPADAQLIDDYLAGDDGSGAADMTVGVIGNLAQQRFGRFDIEGGAALIAQARGLLPRCTRSSTRHFVAGIEGFNHLGGLALDAARPSFHEAWELIPEHEDAWLASWAEIGEPLVDLLAGSPRSALDKAGRCVADSLQAHSWHVHALAQACQSAAAFGLGQLDTAATAARSSVAGFERTRYFYAGAIAYPHLCAALAVRGLSEQAGHVLDEFERVAPDLARNHRLRLLTLAPSIVDLRALAADARLRQPAGAASLFTLNRALTAVVVGDRLEDLAMLDAAVPTLVEAAGRGVRFGLEWMDSVERALALCAFRQGDSSWAREVSASRPDADRSPLEEGQWRLLEARRRVEAGADVAEILDPGGRAVDLFEAIGAYALVGQAHRLLPMLAERVLPAVAIVFTDIVGSTAINEQLGDIAFRMLLREHDALLGAALAKRGGIRFTHTGDGLGARFRSAFEAASFASEVHDVLARRNAGSSGPAVEVRIGIAWGDTVPEDGNLFGMAVNLAARICAEADARQTLASAAFADELPDGFPREALGTFTFRGISNGCPVVLLTGRSAPLDKQGETTWDRTSTPEDQSLSRSSST